jgi:hypothetical protein
MQLFAQDRGAYGKDVILIDWAFGDYRFADRFGLRIGKIKMPKGLYNETRDNDVLRTFVFLPQGFYSDAQRETEIALTGGGLYGVVPAGAIGCFSYEAQVGKLTFYSRGGIANQIKFYGFTDVKDIRSGTTGAYSLEWRTPLEGLRVVGSGMRTTFDVSAEVDGSPVSMRVEDLTRSNASVEYITGSLIMALEYTRTDADRIVDGMAPVAYKPESYYISADYRFTDLFDLGVYYSVFYQNRDHRSDYYAGKPDYTSWQKDLALCLRFDVNKYTVFKVEGHYLDGSALVDLTDLSTTVRYWHVAVTKLTLSF